MKSTSNIILLFALLALFILSTRAAHAQNYTLLSEYIDKNGTNVASRIVVINNQTGSKRVISSIPRNQGYYEGDASYDPQNNTVTVTRLSTDASKTYVEVFDYDSGKLISSHRIGSLSGNSGIRSYSKDSVYSLPPDLSQDVSHLNNRVDNLSNRVDRLDSQYRQLSNKVDKVGALAAALEIERPIDGKLYRLGADLGFFGDETAVGLSFSTIKGPWDGGAGIAIASGETMGKVSAGFNW